MWPSGDAGEQDAGARDEQSACDGARPGERRLWWQLFGLLFLACSAWSLALPLMTGPDEAPQAIRAAAVVRGELTGEAPDAGNARVRVQVPEAYTQADQVGLCFFGPARELWSEAFISRTPRDECPELSGGRQTAEAATTQHRGQPSYYGLVGLPSLVFPGSSGAHLMRLVAAALCAALLASAFTSALRLSAGRLAVVATWVSVTPVVLYMAAVVNSAGIEIVAALSAWLAGLALVRAPGPPDRRLVVGFGLALVMLILARGLSPGFALLIVAVLAVLATPERRRTLAGRPDVRLGLLAAGLATVVSGLWLVYVQRSFPLEKRTGAGLADALGQIGWWLRSGVAVFGSTDVVPPVALHFGWLALVLAVAALALSSGRWKDVVPGVGLVASGLVLITSGHGFSLPDIGFWWQGRYVLPILVGALPVAVSGARAEVGRAGRRLGRFGPPIMMLAVGLHLWAFLYALRHYTVGFFGPANPGEFLLSPDWQPPYGPPLLLAVVFLGSLTLTAAALWQAATRADQEGTAGRPEARPVREGTAGSNQHGVPDEPSMTGA